MINQLQIRGIRNGTNLKAISKTYWYNICSNYVTSYESKMIQRTLFWSNNHLASDKLNEGRKTTSLSRSLKQIKNNTSTNGLRNGTLRTMVSVLPLLTATSVSSVSSFSTFTSLDSTNVPYTSISLADPSLLTDSPSHSKKNLGSFDVYNPASTLHDLDNGSAVIAKVKRMDGEDTKDAIGRSALALTSWRDNTTGMYRSQILNQWSQLIQDNSDDIAKVMTLESGKPLMESFGEIDYATSFIDLYSAEAIRPTSSGGGAIWPSSFVATDGRSPRGKIIAVKEAVGVTAMITPVSMLFLCQTTLYLICILLSTEILRTLKIFTKFIYDTSIFSFYSGTSPSQ